MMLLAFLLVLLIIFLILFIAFPDNLTIILCILAIPFIISIYVTVYFISRSTRMYEHKKYWANMNPTDEVLNKL